MPTPKKKAAKKLKKAARKKSAPKKQTPKKITKTKKSAGNKAVVKKAAAVKPSGNQKTIFVGPSRGMRGLEATASVMDLDITFKLGLGEITATHFSNGSKVDKKKVTKSGRIHFDNVQATDVISINGACSGSCTLITNRQTDPLSDSSQPRLYIAGSIFDNLIVEQ